MATDRWLRITEGFFARLFFVWLGANRPGMTASASSWAAPPP